MKDRYDRYKARIEEALAALFPPAGDGADTLRQAMRYSLTTGGKRIRPVLCLELCRVCGAEADRAIPIACAVELLHTYSLIHDDLPCMDDDDERRGKPSCHKAFGQATAVLAGDCLQAEAFGLICSSDLGAEERLRCCALLAEAGGVTGICGGQCMDLGGADAAEDTLLTADMGKTASLMGAACAMGAAAAGAAPQTEAAARSFGEALGMAFQCRDDLLDGDGFAALLGREACERLTESYTQAALNALECFEDASFLRELTQRLSGRTR